MKKLSKEMSEFIFLEANKKLRSVNASIEILNKKSFAIFTLMFSVLGIIVSFTTDDLRELIFLFPYAVLIIGFLISFFLLAKSVATTTYYGDSFKPKAILNCDKNFLKTKDDLLNGFLIDWYNNSIEYNLKKTKSNGFLINIAILLSLLSLSIFVIFYVYLKIVI